MIDLLRRVLDLLTRWLDWRRDTERDRALDEARRAVAEHDRKALNTWLNERRHRD